MSLVTLLPKASFEGTVGELWSLPLTHTVSPPWGGQSEGVVTRTPREDWKTAIPQGRAENACWGVDQHMGRWGRRERGHEALRRY